MKAKTIYLFLFLFAGPISFISAQIIEKYESEVIYIQGAKYVKNGKAYPIGFAGKKLKYEMTVSPEAIKVFEKYQREANWSFGLGLLAIGTAVAALYVEDNSLKAGLYGVTLSAAIVSFPLSINASKNFHKAIWLRNRDVLK